METRSIQDAASLAGASQFATRLPGKVVFPSDRDYDTARLAWNLSVDQRPAVIIFAENTLDVVEAVTFARQNHLTIAVQGTGHGPIRNSTGAVVINTSRMQGLRIDPQAQTAWFEAGVKWGEVLEQAQAHGLVPLLGSSPDVGAVGYSLGGGMGWLVRKYGLSADSILRFKVVTPDGNFRVANERENSDLFWGLRGGGGGFGVVTSMEIKLFPVTQVYGGNLLYPASLAKEVFTRFREWAANAPDELTTSVVLKNYPPLPQLPPFLSGKSFVIVRGCYCGSQEEGEKLVAYWRDWQKPEVDDFKAMPFTAVASISQDATNPTPFVTSGAWLRELSDEAVDVLIHYTLPQDGPPVMVYSEVRLAGGAVSRVEPESSAYSLRDEKLIWMSLGIASTPEMKTRVQQHMAQLRGALTSSLSGKIYMNFVMGDEARSRTREGYSEKAYQRLQEIKQRYDPDHLMDYSYEF